MGRTSLIAFAAALVAGIVGELRGVALLALACGAPVALPIRAAPAGVRAGTVMALAAGVVLARLHTATPSVVGSAHSTVLAGTVVGDLRAEAFGSTFDLSIDGGPTVEATTSGGIPSIGDRVHVRGRMEPFDGPRNPGEPSMRALEAERGIAGRLVHARVLEDDPPDDSDWAAWFPRARAWASNTLHAELDEPGASILAGALWGERGSLPPELRAEFQDTGTTHILVTAGLHLGVIAALAAWLLGMLGVGRTWSSVLGAAVVWAYAEFSGAHLPSLRAATMISFGLAARACGRPTFSWNALAAAAIVIGVLWTSSVDSLSFALSFSCVAAIMLFAKPFAHALARVAVTGFAAEALALTLATQLGTWPLTAFAFLVFAPYAPLANALVVPVVGLAMLAGLLLLAASPIPLVGHAVANVEGSLLLWIASAVRFVSGLPAAHVVATPPPIWTIAAYDGICLLVAVLVRRRRFALAVLAFVAATGLVLWPPRKPSHDLVVTAIDVGQADSLLIRTPSGHAILVDGGGRLERGLGSSGDSPAEAIGERTVVPFLIRQGIHHLDAILLSHPHGDHKGF